MGYLSMLLVLAVTMLLDIVWGTRASENGHGSCGAIHRFHKLPTAMWLSLRSFLHQCRAMFNLSREALRLNRLELSLQRTRSRLIRLDGRKCYLQDLFDEVKKALVSHERNLSPQRDDQPD